MACLFAFSLMANAQVGSLLQKAAKKAVEKTTDKVIEKTTDAAADAASKAVENQVGKVLPSSAANSGSQAGAKSGADVQPAEPQTIGEVMLELPELPTVQQYVNFKTAEMHEQKLKMFSSPVWTFNFKVATLGVQAVRLACENVDSV